MINRKIVSEFANIIGYIDIVLSFDGFDDIKDRYMKIKKILLDWANKYYKFKSFNFISYDESYKIHEELQDIRDIKIYDKNLGMESMITDDIFIKYEVVVKLINEEKKTS